MSSRIKVVGYSKKEFLGNGIEYRPFSPDLVGVQLASNGTTLFTMGNFNITTNMEPKSDKTFATNKFSNFITLDNLVLTQAQSKQILSDNTKVKLNLDKTNLNYYALFGSLTEFVRVSLESIIINWPASLYVTANASDLNGESITGYTFEDYLYNPLTNESSFKIDTTFINNKFQINYLENGTILNSFNENNSLRNLTIEYSSYDISIDEKIFPIIGFTGSSVLGSGYLYFNIKGNAFSGGTTGGTINGTNIFHIKPNSEKREKFFNGLPNFESYLLNRQISPIYTASFKYPIKTNNGNVFYITNSVTWPVSDGYNIDFDTSQYITYVNKLVDISNNNDLNSSDLVNRFLVTESISDFDTTPVHLSDYQKDTSGQKMNKTLRIYGRELDEINNFITSIKFAHVVTYDKQDNVPDVYLKDLAKILGWDLISSVVENNLLANYITRKDSTFSGHSVGLTAAEADVELWRRLILNSPWIWKSKGSRKSVEFLLRFIGAPQGLVKFNEYIYKADAPIDVELFKKVLELNNLSSDLSQYPIDNDGFPRLFPDTDDMYFQNNGLWYRQTGGSGATIDILTGNNPHLGPYDGGYKYINQFRNLIPNFTAVTITSETVTVGTTNLYTNNQSGTFDQSTINSVISTVDLSGLNNEDLSNCYVVNAKVIQDPYSGGTILNNCGCPCEGVDNVMSLCVDNKNNATSTNNASFNIPTEIKHPCNNLASINKYEGFYEFKYYQYNNDGSLFKDKNGNNILKSSSYANQECCTLNNGTPFLMTYMDGPILRESGYFCCDNSRQCGCGIACDWVRVVNPKFNLGYIEFKRLDGSFSVVTPDGCNCIPNLTIKVPNVVDPYTNQVGVACKVTTDGTQDLLNLKTSIIDNTYYYRTFGELKCNEIFTTSYVGQDRTNYT